MKSRLTRIAALCLCMLLIFGSLVYRLIQLQLIQGPNITAALNANVIREYY